MTEAEEWRPPGVPGPPSPLLAQAIAGSGAAYDALLAISPTTLGDDDLTRLVDAATRLADRSAGVLMAAIGEADCRRLGDSIGARHTAQWWARRSLLARPEANRMTWLGRALTRVLYAPVQAALAAGELHVDQAGVIVRAVEAIPSSPDDLPSHAEPPSVLRGRAVDQLLVLAKDHDALQLKMLGRRILELVAPEVGEAAEAKALADEEADAARKVTFKLRDNGNGTSSGRFTLPTAAAEMFAKQLHAIAAPRRLRSTAGKAADGKAAADKAADDTRPLHARLGWALIEWVEGYGADRLPTSGGTSATVVVTMGLATLLGGVGAAILDTGGKISAGQARRLACEAGIIPAVLGGRSEVLDLGRTRRLHTRAQRLVLGLRDRGCTADGCDLPPAACHAHHDQPWSLGGPTDLDNGRLLCHRHHRLIHDDRYDTTHLPEGKVTFHRRV